MKLTDEYEISIWAYYQCRNRNDTIQMRRLITTSYLAYCYCGYIKDREEMLSKITDYDAYRYCKYIKDRLKVRKNITNSEYAYYYCRNVKDRPEVRRYIKDEINR